MIWKVMKRPGKLMPISVRKHYEPRKRTIEGKDSFICFVNLTHSPGASRSSLRNQGKGGWGARAKRTENRGKKGDGER